MWDLPYCRLCGEPTVEDEGVNILDESDATLKFIILLRLQIKLPVDQFSHLICPACVIRLKEFHSFSKKCYSIQIQLAEVSRENVSQTDGEDATGEGTISRKNVKRRNCRITARNCDNIIIPEIYSSPGHRHGLCAENDIEVYDVGSDDESTPVNGNSVTNNASSKKVFVSKLKDFSFPEIRPKKGELRMSSEENCRPESSFSDVDQHDQEPEDEGKRKVTKLQKRVPSKASEDDIRCPYCRWYIPKDEFHQNHISFHAQDLDSEFHKLVMESKNRTSRNHSVADSSTFHCDDCNKNFYGKLSFLEHRNFHEDRREILCHLCHRAFSSRKRLRAHLCTMHLVKTFACEHCPYRAQNEPDLAKHRLRVHTNARIQCPLCGKLIAAYPHNLTTHLETHNEVPQHVCDLCPAVYRTRAGLQKHRENKHYPNPTMCSMCGKLCTSRLMNYIRHLSACRKRIRKMEEKAMTAQ